jgi:hypothetical protein
MPGCGISAREMQTREPSILPGALAALLLTATAALGAPAVTDSG